MSLDPSPSGRVEPKRRRLRFLESDALVSGKTEFTFGPRFTGADQAWNTLARVAAQMSGQDSFVLTPENIFFPRGLDSLTTGCDHAVEAHRAARVRVGHALDPVGWLREHVM